MTNLRREALQGRTEEETNQKCWVGEAKKGYFRKEDIVSNVKYH
jgi:hypothetical protein